MANKLNFFTNIEGLGDLIGAVDGMDAGMNNSYIAGLITEAHMEAATQFDMVAAAHGTAGFITHMFEYGTAGITRGYRRHHDPTAAKARLWVHRLVGTGGTFDAGFIFRPALSPNPKPTVKHTKVEKQYLDRLSKREYTFRQRAMVMETGLQVTIRPKASKRLFVPFYGQEPTGDPSNKRGFAMVPGPLRVTPGAEAAGTFTAFWNGWWRTEGTRMMEQNIERRVDNDTREVMKRAEAEAGKQRMEPLHLVNVAGEANKAKSDTKRKIDNSTRRRKSRRKAE